MLKYVNEKLFQKIMKILHDSKFEMILITWPISVPNIYFDDFTYDVKKYINVRIRIYI